MSFTRLWRLRKGKGVTRTPSGSTQFPLVIANSSWHSQPRGLHRTLQDDSQILHDVTTTVIVLQAITVSIRANQFLVVIINNSRHSQEDEDNAANMAAHISSPRHPRWTLHGHRTQEGHLHLQADEHQSEFCFSI